MSDPWERLSQPPYYITAYDYAVRAGYTGTEKEFGDALALLARSTDAAEAAAAAAEASQEDAGTAADAAGAAQDAAEDAQEAAEAAQATAETAVERTINELTGVAANWLDEHITNPSSPPVDTSLSVAGAAADAAKAGEVRAAADDGLWYEQGGIEVTEGVISYPDSTTRVRIRPVHFDNKILRLAAKTGYEIRVVKIEDETAETVLDASVGQSSHVAWAVAYKNASFAFLIRRTDNAAITAADARANTSITVCPYPFEPGGNGVEEAVVELSPNRLAYSDTVSDVDYVRYEYYDDRASSAPIPLPPGGLKVSVNPAQWRAGTEIFFRVIACTFHDDGLHLITIDEDADLYAESSTSTSTAESVYIPYRDGVYIIINTASYDSDISLLADAIHIYRGAAGASGANGKLLGLHPMRVFLRDGVPRIEWGTKQSVINTTRYYGGAIWLRYVKSITVSPQYSIIANVYRQNEDKSLTRVDSFYTMEQGSDAGKVAGVQFIDCSGYEFDGFILFAVQDTIRYKADAPAALSYKKHLGMGVMHGYLDVFNNVYVEYKNAYQISVDSGLPETIYENVIDFMEYTYPHRLASYYIHEWETEAQKHYFDDTFDATPAFYSGAYDANSIFLNVTGRSYYTAMANINSRCYQFARDAALHPGREHVYGRIGYGLTCTDFTSVLLGLKENYPPSTMALASGHKFRQISDTWDYLDDMDLLRPGDVLAELLYDGGSEGGDTTTEHCMIVYEIKRVNGQVECITLVEAGYPYTRFTALYNDKYVPLMGEWQSMRRLGDYKYVRRIRSQYLNRIPDVFDLSKSYTPGAIMCDRGSGSIYAINPVDNTDPGSALELEEPELTLTITDDEATDVYIFRDDLDYPHAVVPIGEWTEEEIAAGYKVLDIRAQVNQEGLYKLKLSADGPVEETFWAQGPRFFDVEAAAQGATTRKLHAPDLAHLRYAEIVYEKSFEAEVGGEIKSLKANHYLIIAPEEFEADVVEEGKPWDATWGQYDVPVTAFDGSPYRWTKLVYETDYGTYQLRYMDPKGTGTLTVYASVEYSFGE